MPALLRQAPLEKIRHFQNGRGDRKGVIRRKKRAAYANDERGEPHSIGEATPAPATDDFEENHTTAKERRTPPKNGEPAVA